jgi:hypothetical protein
VGTYNDSLVEVYSVESKEWDIVESGEAFPIRKCDWESLGIKTTDAPFRYQSYAIAAFIAGIRNEFKITPIAERRGLPEGHKSVVETEGFSGIEYMVTRYPANISEDHTNTWLLLKELLDFDYEQTFEDRRNYGAGNHDTVEVGSGSVLTYKEHLGPFFFTELEALKKLGDPEHVRIIFAFD